MRSAPGDGGESFGTLTPYHSLAIDTSVVANNTIQAGDAGAQQTSGDGGDGGYIDGGIIYDDTHDSIAITGSSFTGNKINGGNGTAWIDGSSSSGTGGSISGGIINRDFTASDELQIAGILSPITPSIAVMALVYLKNGIRRQD